MVHSQIELEKHTGLVFESIAEVLCSTTGEWKVGYLIIDEDLKRKNPIWDSLGLITTEDSNEKDSIV